MIAASAKLGLGYADKLMMDIDPAKFASFARIGDKVIVSNHPAFACGHLSIYAARIVKELGCDSAAIEPSPASLELFSFTAVCTDDPGGEIYPGKEELIANLFTNYQAAIVALESASDEHFSEANPTERLRSKFPTIGAMHAFYVSGHFMMHMGQVSAWRRMLGMPPA